MHPELLDNSLFVRYYNQWLEKPDSIVFASVAEYLIKYDHLEEAIKVCREGLKRMPNSVVGRMTLAKAYIKCGETEEADEELRHVLRIIPSHTKALRLRSEIQLAGSTGAKVDFSSMVEEAKEVTSGEEAEEEITGELPPPERSEPILKEVAEPSPSGTQDTPAWQTVTMAKIYSSQGHHDKAKEIYQAILARDPSNQAARDGLSSLGGGK